MASGEVVTAHCPNSGSMQECCESGRGLRYAVEHGIEILVYDTYIDIETITLNRKIPYKL